MEEFDLLKQKKGKLGFNNILRNERKKFVLLYNYNMLKQGDLLLLQNF